MPLTWEQTMQLQPGMVLSFGTDHRYEFTGFAWYGGNGRNRSCRLNLIRDDGYETFATHHDLKKAEVVRVDAPPFDFMELTEETLRKLTNGNLEQLAVQLGLTPPPRPKKDDLVALILTHVKNSKPQSAE